jgi:hypothetical protein
MRTRDDLIIYSIRRRPVYGFIFLFKWSNETSEKDIAELTTDDPAVFFAKQVR